MFLCGNLPEKFLPKLAGLAKRVRECELVVLVYIFLKLRFLLSLQFPKTLRLKVQKLTEPKPVRKTQYPHYILWALLCQAISLTFTIQTMQFILGALTVACVLLVILALAFYKCWVQASDTSDQYNDLFNRMGEILQKIENLQPVQNIINLGLKDGRLTTDITPLIMSVDPKGFVVKADKLKKILLQHLADVNNGDKSIKAYCITARSGIRNILDNKSVNEVDKALTRLLINEDEEATKRFLETLADSVASATETPITA